MNVYFFDFDFLCLALEVFGILVVLSITSNVLLLNMVFNESVGRINSKLTEVGVGNRLPKRRLQYIPFEQRSEWTLAANKDHE